MPLLQLIVELMLTACFGMVLATRAIRILHKRTKIDSILIRIIMQFMLTNAVLSQLDASALEVYTWTQDSLKNEARSKLKNISPVPEGDGNSM